MTAATYGRGIPFVPPRYGRPRVHAVKPGTAGRGALCGTNLRPVEVPGSFVPGAYGSCPACTNRVKNGTP